MTACNACGATKLQSIYRVESTPTSSVTLVTEEIEAARWPSGVVDLDVCEACGFIQNSSYDPAAIDFTRAIEESQFSSGTFVDFAVETIRWLDSEYRLAGRPVLEVGCGKAEWLALACRLLGSRGIGIDPAYVPGRVDPTDEAAIDVVSGFFDESQVHLTGGLVACRHTLEHIDSALSFVRLLGESARHTRDSVVFIEVPDTLRILREGAFWDVYYEHCSYFTSSSLEGLMRRAGLGSVQVKLGYADQYLLATGRPDGGHPPSPEPAELSFNAAITFREMTERSIAVWREVLDDARARGDAVVLWGASSKAVGFLAGVERLVEGAVDINPAKVGSFLPGSGIPVLGPQELRTIRPSLIVVMNSIYQPEIEAMARDLGVQADVVSLGRHGAGIG